MVPGDRRELTAIRTNDDDGSLLFVDAVVLISMCVTAWDERQVSWVSKELVSLLKLDVLLVSFELTVIGFAICVDLVVIVLREQAGSEIG